MTDLVSKDLIQLIDQGETPAGKKKVLKAAIDLFAKDGFSATSTAVIAERAGVSQATIFKYFKNKQALLNDVLNMIINQLVPHYSQDVLDGMMHNTTDIKELISFIVTDRYAFMEANHNLILIVMTEFLTNDAVVAELVTKLKPKTVSLVQVIDRMGLGQLQVSGFDLLQLIVSQLLFLFLKEFRLPEGHQLNIDQQLEQIKNLVIHTAIKN